MLPADVRPLYVATVAASFHSQKAAIGKTYRYRLDTTPHGDPFEARYAWHVPHRIDDRLLEACLAQLPGRRDWSGFAGSRCDKLDRVRSLSVARLDRSAEGRAELTFRADGFLHHMVRNLVGTLLEIATGRMAPATIRAVLSSGDRNRAGPTAPARGLWLMRVHYAADEDPGAAATGGGRSE
jgi:tRNA pseudouridine38-40 synthase